MESPIADKASRWLWLSLLLTVGVGGCGGPATVTGKVNYQGKAVTYGSIIFFQAEDMNRARSGAIQADGSFTVEGVEQGEVKIAVISRDPSQARAVHRPLKAGKADEKTAAKSWVPLPKKYEDPNASGLRCTVDARNFRHDVEIR